MHLQPKHPPGRKRSKVRAFAAEIHRLYADGYTCDEIRDALAEVGIAVSRSTVQRETARGPRRSVSASTRAAAALRTAALSEASTAGSLASQGLESLASRSARGADSETGDPRTARQMAEDFMKNHVSNPLLRTERKPG